VVAVRVGSSTELHAAVLLSPNTAITSSRWLPEGTAPSSVELRLPTQNGPDVVVVASHINRNPGSALAMVRLAQPVPAPPMLPLATAAPSVGASMECLGFVPGPGNTTEMRGAPRVVASVSGGTVVVTGATPVDDAGSQLEDVDIGAPCIHYIRDSSGTITGGELAGFIQSVTAAPAPIVDTTVLTGVWSPSVSSWLSNMRTLSRARDSVLSARNRPVRLNVRPDNVTLKCADLAGASLQAGARINQFGCHSGQNQLFWAVPSTSVSNGFSLVADHSGLCVDVVGGSSSPGAGIQQYPCHFGAAQTFFSSFWPSGTGQRVTPVYATNLCLTVSAATPATRDGTPLSLQTCMPPPPFPPIVITDTIYAFTQRWAFEQR